MASPSSSPSPSSHSPMSPLPTTSLTFADLLRQHRAAAGLTQEELAERAQLSVDAVSTLERGTRRSPRKETVALLAAALALAPEERAAFALAARRSSSPTAGLAATPPEQPDPGHDSHDALAAHDGHAPAAVDLPHGTVTFLFADLEGSTRLLQQQGAERYAELLAEVQELLRRVWAEHAGHELGTQEDRFFGVFAGAEDALAAAAATQQALTAHAWPGLPRSTQVRLRMGVHSGPALLTVGRYVGLEVQLAARVAASGHGGQIVVSQATVEQVEKFGYALPEGTRLRDLGRHRLPGLARRERLTQLVLPALPGLPATFPPLRTQDVWPEVRANLALVGALTLVLLTLAGLLLPFFVPSFPRALGLLAGGGVLVLLAAGGVALLLRAGGQARGAGACGPTWAPAWTMALVVPWREARKGMAGVSACCSAPSWSSRHSSSPSRRSSCSQHTRATTSPTRTTSRRTREARSPSGSTTPTTRLSRPRYPGRA